MPNTRFMLLVAMLGGLALLTGCRSFASGCLKPPEGQNSQDGRPLRIPVGLDSADTREAMKIPTLEEQPAPPPPLAGPCLEYPPQIEKLVDPGLTEKQLKKEERRARREARKVVAKPGKS